MGNGEERMSAQDQALKMLTSNEKPQEKPKVTPCAKKTVSIHETLKEIQEQIDHITIVDLAPVQEQLNDIKSSINTLIVLMEKKVELDALEADVMELLKKKLE